MSQQKFIKMVKGEYAMDKKAVIKKIFLIILGITIFVSGYWFSANSEGKLISDIELELYEKVAADLYEKGYGAIQEVVEEEQLDIEITKKSFIISSAKSEGRGKLVADFQSGELVFSRNPETLKAIILNTANAIILTVFVMMGVYVLTDICQKCFKWLKKRMS